MGSGRVLFDSASRINGTALNRIRKGIGAPNDTLLSHKGTVGKVAWAGEDPPPFVCSPQTTFYRSLDRSVLDPRFLTAFIQSPAFQGQLKSRKGETDMADYVSLTEQRRLLIALPPLPEQRAIAEVLGALDDKIEANRRLGTVATDLVQATWKEVATSAEGSVPFGKVADIEKGLSYKGEGLNSGAPMVNLANFGKDGTFQPEKTKRYSGESKARHWVNRGDLVMANTDLTQRREFLGQPAIVDFPEVRALFTHHVFAVRPKDGDADLLWIYASLRDQDFRNRAVQFATGTTVAALPRDAVLTYELPWPSDQYRREWSGLAKLLMASATAAERETACLAELRDTLLPRLLSGELRVRDAA
jgi:type I restriction enzyme S subunit